MPAFSVIIPTYNRAAVLPKAVRSVLAQDFEDLEVIVVDDGSSDETADVIRTLDDDRVRYVRRENGGLSRARNTGTERAEGRYLAFLDDDDEALPGWLGSFDQAFGSHDYAVVCCGAEMIDDRGAVLEVLLPDDLGAMLDRQVGLFMAGTFALRREVFEASGGFTPDLQSSHATDLAFRLVPMCVARGWRIGSIRQPLVRIWLGDGRRRARDGARRRLEGTTHLLATYGDRLQRSPRTLAEYLAVAGVSAARLGHFATARRFFARSLRAYPRQPKNLGRLLVSMAPPVARKVW